MDFGEEQVFPRGRLFLDAPDVVHEVDNFHHVDERRGGSRASGRTDQCDSRKNFSPDWLTTHPGAKGGESRSAQKRPAAYGPSFAFVG